MTLFSFLGGAAFRLIFGSVMEWLNREQEHTHEVALQQLQSELDDKRHARDCERIRLQADLKVTEVQVVSDAAERQVMGDAFLTAVRATTIQTGIRWVDAWNQTIRPAGASLALLVWVVTMAVAGFVLTDFDKELMAAFLGIFIGDRIHQRMK